MSKIIEKYENMSPLVKAIVVTLAANVALFGSLYALMKMNT